MVLKQQLLPKVPTSAIINAEGIGSALVTFSYSFYLKNPNESNEKNQFELTIKKIGMKKTEYNIQVCFR